MKRIGFGIIALALALLLSWSYAALSQRPDMGVTVQGKRQKDPAKEEELNDAAKQLVIQQQESRENMRRLAEGQIKNMDVVGVDKKEKEVFIKVFYADQSSLDGRIDIESVQGNKLCVVKITRLGNSSKAPGGQVASVGPEELDLGRSLVQAQLDEQDVMNDLLDGNIKGLVINNTQKTGNDASTVEATAAFKNGTSKLAKIDMVFFKGFWYVKSASY